MRLTSVLADIFPRPCRPCHRRSLVARTVYHTHFRRRCTTTRTYRHRLMFGVRLVGMGHPAGRGVRVWTRTGLGLVPVLPGIICIGRHMMPTVAHRLYMICHARHLAGEKRFVNIPRDSSRLDLDFRTHSLAIREPRFRVRERMGCRRSLP